MVWDSREGAEIPVAGHMVLILGCSVSMEACKQDNTSLFVPYPLSLVAKKKIIAVNVCVSSSDSPSCSKCDLSEKGECPAVYWLQLALQL